MKNDWYNSHAQLPARSWMFKDYSTGKWPVTVLAGNLCRVWQGVVDDFGNWVEVAQ